MKWTGRDHKILYSLWHLSGKSLPICFINSMHILLQCMLISNTRHFSAASFFPFPELDVCGLDLPALFSPAAFLKSVFSSFKQFNWISFFLFDVFVSLLKMVVRALTVAVKGSK